MEDYKKINPFTGIENPLCSSSNIRKSVAKLLNITEESLIVEMEDGTFFTIMNHELNHSTVNLGAIIDVYIDDNYHVAIINSKYKAFKALTTVCNLKQTLEGRVVQVTNNGLLMNILGCQTFMPNGQIDNPAPTDTSNYLDKTLDARLINIKLKQFEDNRFLTIVSHKVLVDENNAKDSQIMLDKLHIGDVMTGVVKSIANYGAFVTLSPGIDGLIHITDISWKKIRNINEILSVGQSLEVKILDIIHQSNGKVKIALGHKQLTPKPWDALDSNLMVGDIVSGVVSDIQDYGLFVQIHCGVEGLVHRTEITWGKESGNPRDFVIGDTVKAKVIGLDRENEKMLMSFKQIIPNPWDDIESKLKIGQIVRGTIETIVNFGVFVEFNDGLNGLVHISELSWYKLYGKPKDFYRIGDFVDVKVIGIDKEKNKIELSLKQATSNPWPELLKSIGTLVDGTVLDITKKGIRLKLDSLSAPGFIPKSGCDTSELISVGMKLKCKIHEAEEKQGLIILDLINNGI